MLILTELIAQTCPGTPNFTWTQTCGTYDLQFTNTSTVPSGKTIDSLKWDFGDGSPVLTGTPSTVGSPFHTYASSGTYTVILQIFVNPDSCWKQISMNVEVTDSPVASFSFNPDNACSPVTVNFSNSSSGTGLSYQWDFGDGSPTSSDANPSHDYDVFGSGSQVFTVTLIVTDVNGCKDTVAGNVTVKQRPNIDFYDDRNWKHCAYGAIAADTLTFENISPDALIVTSYYIQWGDGNDTTVSSFTSLDHVYYGMGNYNIQVTATGSNGCTSTWNQALLVDQTPVAGIDPPAPGSNEGCAPLTLTIGNNSTYNPSTTTVSIQWGDGQVTNLPINTPSGGNYNHTYTTGNCGAPTENHTITLTASNGCNTSIATYCCVNVNIPPQAFFTHTSPTCIDQPITFYNYSSRNECASNPNSRYKWDFGDGTVIPFTVVNSNTSPQQVLTHTYTQPGTYVVTLTAYNPSPLGCDSTTFQRTIVIGDMFPDFVSDTSCVGQELTHFSSTSTDTIINIVSYQWSFSSASPSTASGANVSTTYTAGGNQSATLTITANNGCVESITKPVYVWRLPTPNFTYSNKCEYEAVPFTDLSTMSPDSNALVSWYWNFDDGTHSTEQNPSHLFPTHGEFWVTLTVTDSVGCHNTTNYKKVLAYPKPTANFNNTLACESLMVNYTNSSSSPLALAHHHWSCCYFYSTWRCYPDYPWVCTSQGWWYWNTTLSYEWDFGDGSPISTDANPQHYYSPPGNYTNTLIVTNIYGCKDTLQRVLTVHINPTADFIADTVCFGDTTHFSNLSLDNGGTLIASYQWNFGDATTSTQTDPDKRYDNPGMYNVSLITTNQAGCKDTTLKLVRVWRLPIDSFAVSNVCYGDTLSPVNNSAPTDAALAQWIWNFGDGTIDTAYSSAHLYDTTGLFTVTFTVVDSNNCRSTYSKPVRVYDLPIANFGFSAGCLGYGVNFYDSSTIVSPSVNGNINSWYWSFGDGADTTAYNPVHEYESIGNYTINLIVETSHGCKDTANKEITVHVSPVASFRYDTVCFKEPTPFYDESVPMPADIIQWYWSFGDGQTDSTQHPLHIFPNPGTYNTVLTIWDTNGCYNQIVRPVRVDSLPRLDFVAANVCFGDSVNIFNYSQPTQGSPIVSWYWDFGDGTYDNHEHPYPHFYGNDTIYTISLIAENDLGCRDTLKKTVHVYTLPIADFNATTACQKMPVEFADVSFNPIASIVGWNWDFGDTSSSTLQNPTHVYPYPGDTLYTVTLMVRDSHNCYDTIQKVVRLNPKPRAGFFANVACSRDTTFFTDTSWAGGTIAQWLWNFGDGIGSSTDQNPTYIYPVVTVPTQFNTSLIVIDSNNCRDTIIKPVLVNPQPVAEFFADSACYGFANQLIDLSNSTGGAIVSQLWDFGDSSGLVTGDSVQHVYTHPITHTTDYLATLVVTDVNGCRDTIVKSVRVFPLPVPDFNMDTTCFGNATDFTSLAYSTTGPLVYYYWNFGDGSDTVDVTNPSHTYTAYGIYPVKLIVRDIKGCVDSIVKVAAIDSLPTPLMHIEGFCAEDTTNFLDLSLPNGGQIESYYWKFGDGYYSTWQNPHHYYDSAGTYEVTLIVTNSRGCSDSVKQWIEIMPPIRVDYVFDTVCAGTPTSFQAFYTEQTGADVQTWSWDFGDGVSGQGQQVQNTYMIGGYYTAILTATDQNGCSKKVIKLVPVIPAPMDPVFFTQEFKFCKYDEGYVYVLYNQEDATIYWYDQPGGNLLGTGDTLWLGTMTNPTTVYALNVSSEGCKNLAGFVPVNVHVNELPFLELVSDKPDNTAYLGQQVQFTAMPSLYPSYQFYINGYEVSDSEENQYVTSMLTDGDTIMARAYDGACYSPMDTIIFKILPIPNAFTPDGDGINDRFVPGLDLEIVNRWGLKLYRGTDGWDGRYKGEYVEPGTYYYIIHMPGPENTEKLLKGTVTVVRNQ